jgi:hypothetical protein
MGGVVCVTPKVGDFTDPVSVTMVGTTFRVVPETLSAV